MQKAILQGWAIARKSGRDAFFFITDAHKEDILRAAVDGIRNHPTFNSFDITGFIDSENCAVRIGKPDPQLTGRITGNLPRVTK
jgi:hypothetical protein